MKYFERDGTIQPDGRAFDERTLQAVNLTAANVGSYRELAAAFAIAQSGSVITINESITVPRGFQVSVPNLTIRCIGRGAIKPSEPNLTLFTFNDVQDCKLLDIVVNENRETEFAKFVEYKVNYTSSAPFYKNISITGCDVCSKHFFSASDIAGVKEFNYDPTNFQFVYNWAHSKTFIQNNVHRSITPLTEPTGMPGDKYKANVIFISGAMYNASVHANTTEGYIDMICSNVIFSNNGVYGARYWPGPAPPAAGHYAIWLDTSGLENIVTSNIHGFQLLIPATSINANNMAV